MLAKVVIDTRLLGDDTAMVLEDVVSDVSVDCFPIQCWTSASSSIVPAVIMPQYKIAGVVSFFLCPARSHQAPWHERRSFGYASISHQSGKNGPTIHEVIKWKRDKRTLGRAKREQKRRIVESAML